MKGYCLLTLKRYSQCRCGKCVLVWEGDPDLIKARKEAIA